MQTIKDSIKTIAISLLTLSLVVGVASAWTEPTSNPPADNVNPPITTSFDPQTKTGWFTADNIETYGKTTLATVTGNVGIGTTGPKTKLEVAGISRMTDWSLPTTGQGLMVGYYPSSKEGRLNTYNYTSSSYDPLRISAGYVIMDGINPASSPKLSVEGPIKISKNNSLTCSSTLAGTIKLNSSNNALEFCNGTSWKTIGYETVWLVNNLHDEDQCVASGGTVVDDGAGNKMCKFTSSSCPVGWTQYNNWSTTQNNSANYINETVSGSCSSTRSGKSQTCGTSTASCSVSGHSWSNISQESSPCSGIQKTYDVFEGSDYPCSISNCSGATNITVTASRTEIGCY